ncbi:hypothetical protein [Azotobacter chroococcum]|uniref:hypothetical protein n=1 Tax=Azotobacter chroococcum TaxID=353 RepID=UPI0013F16312|nr:hypothetical protein [Azotobacter chroococcum]
MHNLGKRQRYPWMIALPPSQAYCHYRVIFIDYRWAALRKCLEPGDSILIKIALS